MNLLAISAPTQCLWTGIKTIFRYLMDTIEMGLFYPYRETRKYGKMGAKPVRFVDTVEYGDRPVDRQLSTGRRTGRTINWCVQRPDVFLPSRRITDSISITPYFQTLVMFWKVLLMLGISLTLIKVVPIWVMSLPWNTPCYLGSLLNRLLSLLLRTMLRSSP